MGPVNSLLGWAKQRARGVLSRPDRHPNLHWSVNWTVTSRCVLNCDYCLSDHQAPLPDAWAAAERIVRMKPFEIIVTGGEPLVVPDMASIVRFLYERLDRPRIALNTNLILPFEKVAPLLPYVDVLMTSVDGLGGDNRVHRHVDGERVLDQVRRVCEWRRDSARSRPLITVNGTLTPYNYRTVPELARRLADIDPAIHYSVATVEPYWHELSLFEHPEALRDCALLIRRAAETGAAVHAYGLLHDVVRDPEGFLRARETPQSPAPTRQRVNLDDAICVECVRQFFWGTVTPEGELQHCKARFHNRLLARAAWDAFLSGRPFRGVRLLGRLCDHLYLHPTNPRCYAPCKCDVFVEHILTSREGQPPHAAVELWRGRVPPEKLEYGLPFLKKHFGIELGREVIDTIRRREP